MAAAKSKSTNASKPTRQRKQKREGPKKALSTYLMFSMARRETILKERPELKSNVTEISKIIGAEWRQMSNEEKLPYQLQHEKDKERYLREKEEFDKRMPTSGETPPVKRQKTSSRSAKRVVPSTVDEEDDEEDEENDDLEQEDDEDGDNNHNSSPSEDIEDKRGSIKKPEQFKDTKPVPLRVPQQQDSSASGSEDEEEGGASSDAEESC